MRTVLEELADYATSLSADEIPEPARGAVLRAFVDGIACAFYGIQSRPAETVRSVAAEMGGSPGVSLWGLAEKTSAYWAALVNGVALRYWDFNDVYFGPAWTAHPSDNIAAVFGAAEHVGATGGQFLDALVVAYEIQMAFSDLPVEANLWHRGWHHTVACSYASAAAASRLLGLDADQAADAMALAGARSNTLAEIRHGAISMDKALSAPFAAASGLLCAFLARAGYTGCRTLLEGRYGFGFAVAGGAEVSGLIPDRGAFRAGKISLKPYPVEGMTITMVEAALNSREKYDGRIEDISAITVRTYEEALTKPSWDDDKIVPASKETADHSFTFCVALAIVAGRVTLEEFGPEWLTDPRVLSLIPRIRFETSGEYTELYRAGSRPAAVEIHGPDGSAFSEVLHPRGDPARPADWRDLRVKFAMAAEPYLGADTDSGFERLMAIDQDQDIRSIARLLRGHDHSERSGHA